MAHSRIVGSRAVLAVQRLDVSTRYYIDVLGFTRDPIEAAGWSFLSRDAFHVMLGECPDDPPAGTLGCHSNFMHLMVEAVDDYYAEIAGRGALVLSPPTDKPWGLREFTVATPDGHRLTCAEPVRTSLD